METRVQWRIYIVQDFPKSPGNVHAQNSRYIPCSWFIFSRVWSNVSYTVPYTYYPSLVPRTAWVWGWCYPHSKKRNVAVTSLNVTTLISVFTVCTCMTPCSWPYKLLICLQGDWELQDQDIYIYTDWYREWLALHQILQLMLHIIITCLKPLLNCHCTPFQVLGLWLLFKEISFKNVKSCVAKHTFYSQGQSKLIIHIFQMTSSVNQKLSSEFSY